MKGKIRKEILHKRDNLSKDEVKENSKIIFNHCIKLVKDLHIKNICSYSSINNEVDTRLLNNFLKENYRIYLPVVLCKKDMEFIEIDNSTKYEYSSFGIKEPVYDECKILNHNKHICVITPVVAIDGNNRRIGYGCGYYDRYFELIKEKCIFIALAYDFQIVDDIVCDELDIKLDYIVTNKGIYII